MFKEQVRQKKKVRLEVPWTKGPSQEKGGPLPGAGGRHAAVVVNSDVTKERRLRLRSDGEDVWSCWQRWASIGCAGCIGYLMVAENKGIDMSRSGSRRGRQPPGMPVELSRGDARENKEKEGRSCR